MKTKIKEALLYLVKEQHGKWADVQELIEPQFLEEFETLGYLRHVDNKWQITSKGIRQSLYYAEPKSLK